MNISKSKFRLFNTFFYQYIMQLNIHLLIIRGPYYMIFINLQPLNQINFSYLLIKLINNIILKLQFNLWKI